MVAKAAAPSAEIVPEPRLHRVFDDAGKQVGELPEIGDDGMRRMYRSMLLVRLLDERMMILQRQGRIGFYGACTGQEAPPVATAEALAPTDWIFPALREGVAMLHRGYDLETYICQVFGNAGDALKGRQMPSHYADKSVYVASWGSCIGTQLPQAAGAAMGAKLSKDGGVVVGFMGDGATSEADFHTAMGFTSTHQLPCVLICQNNHWSISVPTARQTNARSIAEKAYAYGLPFARVDGNDALAAYGAVKEAADRARRGEGGAFIEMLTYRIGAHSSSDDPRVYRDEREVEVWKKKDPIERFRRFLMDSGRWTEGDEADTRAELDRQILDAVKRAEAHPPPPPESLFEDVYDEPPPSLLAQAHEAGAR